VDACGLMFVTPRSTVLDRAWAWLKPGVQSIGRYVKVQKWTVGFSMLTPPDPTGSGGKATAWSPHAVAGSYQQ